MSRAFALVISILTILSLLLFSRPNASLANKSSSKQYEGMQAFLTPTPSLPPEAATLPLLETFQASATPGPSETMAPLIPAETITPTSTASLPDLAPTRSPWSLLDLLNIFFPYISRNFPQPTATPTFTPTATSTPDTTTRDLLKCDSFSGSLAIPDNNPSGVSNSFQIADPGLIVDLDVYLNIDHTWVGDLSVKITHEDTGHSIFLVDRPGIPASADGCSSDDIVAILDDGASSYAESRCHTYPPAIAGSYRPSEPLSSFDSELAAGRWTINVADLSQGSSGRFYGWCMDLTTAASMPAPGPTPTPTQLPSSALVQGVTGVNQKYSLDCESRAAVDWARFFGFNIGEDNFLFNLPQSDDPDVGFVGYYNGTWGNIPPDDYGVHAGPVAALLRSYGVQAYAHRYLRWRDVQAEIAAGRPVIVWTIGQAVYGSPVYYTAQNGKFTVVARYEHTVMVAGYTQSDVIIQDGSKRYSVPLAQFLDSWSALRNMAVLAHP